MTITVNSSSAAGDAVLGIFYSVNLVLGLPGNSLAFFFFHSQAPDLPTILYQATTVVDLLILLFSVPTLVSLINYRAPSLLGSSFICTLTGMLSTVLPAFSVAIVGVLCCTRAFQLIFSVVRPPRPLILSVLLIYLVYLVLGELIPVLSDKMTFLYTKTEMYCWDKTVDSNDTSLAYLDIALDTLSFALPVIPILLCTVLTIVKITASRRFTCDNKASTQLKSRATWTILIFTGAYILFNIPIFVTMVLRVLLFVHKESYPGRYFDNNIMYWYGWNTTKTLLPAMNSATNPFIYWFRMYRFRKWLRFTVVGGREAGRNFRLGRSKFEGNMDVSTIGPIQRDPLSNRTVIQMASIVQGEGEQRDNPIS